MRTKNTTSRFLSLSLLSTLLLAGAFALPASAADKRDDRSFRHESNYSRFSYARGYRDGYQAGFRDGREEARRDRRGRSRSLRRIDPRTPYDRGFAVAYERGFDRGYASVRRDRRDRWDD